MMGKNPGWRMFDPVIRMGVVASLILIGFALLFIRLGYIQLGPFGGRLSDLNRRFWSNMYVHAQRGRIMDREHRVLAASIESRSVYAHPAKVKDKYRVAQTLSRCGFLSLTDSLEKLNMSAPFVWLVRGIELDQWNRYKNEFVKMDGVGVLPEWRRRYPLGPVGANLIGFVGADGHGLAGMEYTMDHALAGDEEGLHVEMGEHGMPVVVDANGKRNPVFRGHDVTLTVDAYVQEFSDQILKETVDKYEAKGGSVVVVDPRTGEIIAMSSNPSFDPNHFSDYPPSYYKNQNVSTIFEPGSIFKIVTISALTNYHPSVFGGSSVCQGSIKLAGVPKPIRCSHTHGFVDFRRTIEVSCNVGIIRAAQSLSQDEMFRTIQTFGFGIPTGLEYPGEEKGIMRKPYQWSLSTQASLSIGHEIAVTNLQMAMALSAIANGGNLLKPQTVRDNDTTTQILRRVLKMEDAFIVKNYLQTAVEGDEATGKQGRVHGVKIAGKTGTALIPNPKTGGYYSDRFVSSFVGMLPAESPKFVITVVIHEPNPSIAHYGGDVAAPVFSRIASAIMKLSPAL